MYVWHVCMSECGLCACDIHVCHVCVTCGVCVEYVLVIYVSVSVACVHVCVYVYMGVACMENRRGSNILLYPFQPFSLRQGLSLSLELMSFH